MIRIEQVYFDGEGVPSARVRGLVEAQDDTTFLSYDPRSKLLRFRVQHFSTYGFTHSGGSGVKARARKEDPTRTARKTEATLTLAEPFARRRLQAWAGSHCEQEVDPCPRGENDCDPLRARPRTPS